MSKITLSKSNFFYNLDKIQEKTRDISKIALVLKDNAYGHGLIEMATLAKEYGIQKAVVRSYDEAMAVVDFFEYVLVLADTPKSAHEKILYTINDADSIQDFPVGTRVELKVNTSMNRNGVNKEEIESCITKIKEQGLRLEAIFMHHSCADESNGNYELQKSNFELIKKEAPKGLRFHSCNSAALFREDDFSEDMVRVGIAAYGCMELDQKFFSGNLRAILSLYAKKISSRKLQKGESVGYGATFIADDAVVVSNYDFGYGDGFLRACSGSYKTPEDVKIAGRISMDNSSFLTDKESLLIFNDARTVAPYAQTISYEVLTSLKSYIKREIV